MNTHSIRNKSTNPIITFSKPFWKQIRSGQPDSFVTTLAWFKGVYRSMTGKSITLTHEQMKEFHAWVGADDRGYWHSKFSGVDPDMSQIIHCFQYGLFANHTMSMEEVWKVSEKFYNLLKCDILSINTE